MPLLPELFHQLRVVPGGVVAQPQVVVRVDPPHVYLHTVHNNHHFFLLHCSTVTSIHVYKYTSILHSENKELTRERRKIVYFLNNSVPTYQCHFKLQGTNSSDTTIKTSEDLLYFVGFKLWLKSRPLFERTGVEEEDQIRTLLRIEICGRGDIAEMLACGFVVWHRFDADPDPDCHQNNADPHAECGSYPMSYTCWETGQFFQIFIHSNASLQYVIRFFSSSDSILKF